MRVSNLNSSLSPTKANGTRGFTLVSDFQGENDEVYDNENAMEEVVNLDMDMTKLGSYTMTNAKHEKFERKFNDFILLRKALVHNFPGCYIPKIPDKRLGVDEVRNPSS